MAKYGTTNKRKRKVLAAAIECLDRGWNQGEEALDAEGNPVSPISTRACSWCAIGAIEAAIRATCPRHGYEFESNIRDRIIEDMRGSNPDTLWEWNDHPDRTFSEVRSAFEEALKAI